MMSPEKMDAELLEIIGHLGAADVQSTDSDDQIIMGHVRSARDLAIMLRRRLLVVPASYEVV